MKLRSAVLGLAVMGGVALVVDRAAGWPSRRQWLEYAFIGVLLLAVGNGLVMWSERIVPSDRKITAVTIATAVASDVTTSTIERSMNTVAS